MDIYDIWKIIIMQIAVLYIMMQLVTESTVRKGCSEEKEPVRKKKADTYKGLDVTQTLDTSYQPYLPHIAYKNGDLVIYNRMLWSSDIDNNCWRPGEYGWSAMTVHPGDNLCELHSLEYRMYLYGKVREAMAANDYERLRKFLGTNTNRCGS